MLAWEMVHKSSSVARWAFLDFPGFFTIQDAEYVVICAIKYNSVQPILMKFIKNALFLFTSTDV